MARNPYAQRGLDPELASRLGAGYGQWEFRNKQGKTFSLWGYTFEFKSKGVVAYGKFRTPEKDFIVRPSGRRKLLWGLDMIEGLPLAEVKGRRLVFVEGEFDRITVVQEAGGYCVSVPNGALQKPTDPETQVADDKAFDYLWGPDLKLIPEISQFDQIVLAVDGDGPGLLLRDELALRIGPGKCWFVTYPEGTKDPNEVLLKYGGDAVRKLINGAKPMRPGYLVKFGDLPPAAPIQTFSTGFPGLDKNLMLVRPETMVVTGIPGHGKGIWVRALCCNLAERYGLRTAMLIPEDRLDVVGEHLVEYAMRDGKRNIIEADSWRDNHFLVSSFPDDEEISLERVFQEIEAAVWIHNCQIYVIDPWNEIDHNRGSITETEYIEKVIRSLNRLARKLNIILIIVAHPTKLKPGERPTTYSISGSAHWRNKSYHAIIIERINDEITKEPTSICTVTVEKCKIQPLMGRPGELNLYYIEEHHNYYEPLDGTRMRNRLDMDRKMKNASERR